MKKMSLVLKQNRLITISICVLAASFLLVRIIPSADIPLWEIKKLNGYIGLAQYYTSLFASFMTFVIALSLNEIMKNKQTIRSVFLSTGFFTLSFFLFINSLTIPNLIFANDTEGISVGALQLGLFLSGVFFLFSGFNWPQGIQKKIINLRIYLWFALFIGSFIYFYFGLVNKIPSVSIMGTQIQNIVIVLLFCVSSWQSMRLFLHTQLDFDYKMSISFVLLALLEVIFIWGPSWHLSWFFYVPTLLSACIVAITAVLGLLKTSPDISIVRYFAILGSTLIIAFSIANVEFGITWIPAPVNRIWLIPFVFMQGVLSFTVLLFIVIYLNRLITQRTDALRREQHQRTELTQLIVHDLKSPLTVILSGMSLLAHENLGTLSTKQKKLLSSLEKSGYDILSMINDLLDVEKLEEGKLQLVHASFDPIKLVQERVEALQIIAHTHQQTLSFSPPPQRPLIRADKRLIQRVINNLISNALKFTPDNGRIEISVENKKETITINIADSGPGIPQNDRQRIFEKFAQLKGNERRGAGLGLTFCKMVTEAHQGELTIIESPLGGALFKLTLPIWQETIPEDFSYSSSSPNNLSLANPPHS